MEGNLFKQYQEFVRDNWTDGSTDLERLFIMTAGLAGETGEVVEVLKKHVRDGKLRREDLILELGDVLHYWTRICQEFALDPDTVMDANIRKLQLRRGLESIPSSTV